MKKEKKPEHFIKKPAYPGGPSAMKEFIRQNLKYPQEAAKNKIEGIVVVKFELNQKGEVIDAKVISGLGYGCDEEAIRVVKLLKFSKVKNRGLRVTFHKTINMHFHPPAAPVSAQINYSYKETSPKPDKQEPGKKPGTFNYTIITNSRS